MEPQPIVVKGLRKSFGKQQVLKGIDLSVDKGEITRAYFELERAGLVRKKTGRDFLGKEKATYFVN